METNGKLAVTWPWGEVDMIANEYGGFYRVREMF